MKLIVIVEADLLAADNTDLRVVLCARPGLITPEQLARAARAAAHEKASPGEHSPCAVVLPGGDPGRIAAVRLILNFSVWVLLRYFTERRTWIRCQRKAKG